MLLVYLLAFIALLPIFAYLLSPKTKNKGYIFGISFLVLIFCLFSFTGKYAFPGIIKEQKIKDKLKDLTSEAFKLDVFGAPTFLVNNKLFWGQDRLEYAIDESKN